MKKDTNMPRDFSLRRHRLLSALAIIFFIAFTVYGIQSLRRPHGEALYSPPSMGHALPQLPEYHEAPDELAYCAERFGLDYLQNLSNSSVNYCTDNSASRLTCFRSKTEDNRVDSFCIGGPAVFERTTGQFELDCDLRQWTAAETGKGIPRLEQFPSYWYETGPRYIFNKYIRTDAAGKISLPTGSTSKKFSILIKREEKVTNVWHSLMEISALFMTLDVLRMTSDPATGLAFFSTEDIENTQVIVLDDHPDGPFYNLWSLFAKQPMIRMSGKSVDILPDLGNIIIPLPGGSNPLWQGDWKLHSCDHSELWHTFSQRVLDFYEIESEQRLDDAPLVLTFIDRKEKRRLIDKELYIEKLKTKFPSVEIQLVDFAPLSFAEQLKIARRTDILVGVHGAGLTHELFLQPGSTVVEIIPRTLKHKGFRNLAKLLGHHYFSSHAEERPAGAGKVDWQEDDVVLEEDRFMGLLEVAVKSMYNRGLLNSDVTR